MNKLITLPLVQSLKKSSIFIITNTPYPSHDTLFLRSTVIPFSKESVLLQDYESIKTPYENSIKELTGTVLDEFTQTSNLALFQPNTIYNHTSKIPFIEVTEIQDKLVIDTGVQNIIHSKRLTRFTNNDNQSTVTHLTNECDATKYEIIRQISCYFQIEMVDKPNTYFVFNNKKNNKINVSALLSILQLMSNDVYFYTENQGADFNTKDTGFGTIIPIIIDRSTKEFNTSDNFITSLLDVNVMVDLFKQRSNKNNNQNYVTTLRKAHSVFSMIMNNVFLQPESIFIFSVSDINYHITSSDKDTIISISSYAPDDDKTQAALANTVVVFKNITDDISDTLSNCQFIKDIENYVVTTNKENVPVSNI